MICIIASVLILILIIGWLIYEVKNAPTIDSELTYPRTVFVNDIEDDKIKVL